MKSIKSRILNSHFTVIFLTVVIVEVLILGVIRNYYYGSIEELLREQVGITSSFYNKYLTSMPLDKVSNELIENFSSFTNAEIQVLNKDKKIIDDSIGNIYEIKVPSLDIKQALKGRTSIWTGNLEYTNESAMSVSAPLKKNNNVVGVVRVITTLENVDSMLNKMFILIIISGAIIVLITTMVSIVISNTIVRPLNHVTNIAKEMSKGNYSLRVRKKYDDEVGSLADTLNYMAEEIIKNERLKNDFISSISHELRTPLTSIKGWALTLKLKEFEEQVKRDEGLDIIVEESERLTALVEELLDFSRFQSGRITLNIEEIDIENILKNIIRQMLPRAKRLGININNNISKLPFMKGDISRLKQVFINIIDNALKFTEEGGEITLSAFYEEGTIKIAIQDTGCGIRPEDIPNITKKFYKGDSKKAGSGIGLAICDEIVKLHGGSISIESVLGKGTTVTVILNLEDMF